MKSRLITAIILTLMVFFLPPPSFAAGLLETEAYLLSMETYFRADLITLKNTVNLDSRNHDDRTTYLGIDYSFAWDLKPKERGPEFYLKLERHGPGDYDAPIFVHNTLINSGGRIDKYRNEQLLPELEELWLDTPLPKNFGFKAGLYTYEAGNGFALNGSYKNYGATIYQDLGDVRWRAYYCRPDIFYKTWHGPKIPQEREQGYSYHKNAANFFALDARLGRGDNFIQPYVGALVDYTASGKRDNAFSAPIDEDILGTIGLGGALKSHKIFTKLELARNFGEGKSKDASYKDITHAGYLAYAELGAHIKKFSPSVQFLLASGNKVKLDQASDTTLTSGRNTAFSSFSPFNKNLGDSIGSCNAEAKPLILMGSGCGLHNGIVRPGTLASSDFENLIMPSLGFEIAATRKLKLGLRNYYLMCFARPVGTWDGEAIYLSRELGDEVDAFAEYQLNKNIMLSLWAGLFFPGRFYKARRDDTGGSLLSPFVRGDGSANNAFQVEFSFEYTF